MDDVETDHVIFVLPPVHDRAASPANPSIEETVTVAAPE
jgi:hypothetical protein